MQWIKAYILRHKVGILMYLAFCFIFAIVLYLYRMPMEPVLYAVGLCFALALIVLAADSARYRKKAEALLWHLEAVKNGTEKLPKPEDEMERLYQMLLENVQIERARQVGEILKEKSDVTDYFTLWTHQIKTPIAAMHLLLQQEIGLQKQESGTSERAQGAGVFQKPDALEGTKGPCTFQKPNTPEGTREISGLQEPEAGELLLEEYYAQKRELESELFKVEQYVEMVLQYLRLNSSVNDFVLQEYDLDSIIRQAVCKYAPMFIRKKLSLQYSPVQAKAVTDEKWLVFVLEQILSNAIKYTAAGGISIFMENGCLVVADTGIGILPEDLPRIFEKGYTGYNGRGDKKASGIGLYLVKMILDKLGHKVLVESGLGEGTKVKLLF